MVTVGRRCVRTVETSQHAVFTYADILSRKFTSEAGRSSFSDKTKSRLAGANRVQPDRVPNSVVKTPNSLKAAAAEVIGARNKAIELKQRLTKMEAQWHSLEQRMQLQNTSLVIPNTTIADKISQGSSLQGHRMRCSNDWTTNYRKFKPTKALNCNRWKITYQN